MRTNAENEIRELIGKLVPDHAEFLEAVAAFDEIDERLGATSDPDESWQVAYEWAKAKLKLYHVERMLLERILAGHEAMLEERKNNLRLSAEDKIELKKKLDQNEITRAEYIEQSKLLNEPRAKIRAEDVRPLRMASGRVSLLIRALGARSETLFPVKPAGGLRKFGQPSAVRQSPLDRESYLETVCRFFADRHKAKLERGNGEVSKETLARLERVKKQDAINREENRLLRQEKIAERNEKREARRKQAVKNVEAA